MYLYELLDLSNREDNLNDPIKLYTDIPLNDGKEVSRTYFWAVEARAEGGAQNKVEYMSTMIICGWEKVTLTRAGSIVYDTYTHLGDVTKKNFFYYSLGAANFTSNDTYCPTNNYYITEDNPIDLDDATMYTDNSHFQVLFPDNNETLGQALWVRPGGIQGQWHFYVLGRTASGNGAYKEAYMSLTDNC